MKRVIDMAGQRIGMLTVLHLADDRSRHRASWVCRCDCGEIKTICGHELRGVRPTQSCGCRGGKWRHGGTYTPTYGSWKHMIRRCTNPKSEQYANYGGRGIAVCERWLKFENFLADIGERPRGTTIDRYPNNDGHYEPGNCRWATATQQRRNMRTNRLVTYQGRTQALAEWCEQLGLNYAMVRSRLRAGSTPDRAFQKSAA